MYCDIKILHYDLDHKKYNQEKKETEIAGGIIVVAIG